LHRYSGEAQLVGRLGDADSNTFDEELIAMEENDAFVMDLAVGSRFRVKSLGKHSRRLDGRTGRVVGFAHTKNALRVILDGQKSPQTLHRSYLEPLAETAS